VHAALSVPSRLRLVEVLRGSREPLDADTLAERTGLHRNTVRFHVDVLADAGLVSRRADKRGQAGRPRLLYSLARDLPGVEGDGYRMLAGALAAHLAHRPKNAGREGEAAGRELAETLPTGTAATGASAARQVKILFTELGFAPELRVTPSAYQLRLHRCPFRELAAEHPDVVCGLHLGLLRQTVAQMGAPVPDVSLKPFVGPDLCIAELARATAVGG
jgi:predicted ArsR family transcriptional regulator